METLILSGGITTVAEEAFKDFDSLTAVDFGDALKEAGPQAFMGCDALEFIRLPATFRLFARESFRECSSLKTIYCEGNMPSFKGNCLWTGHYITIYHPLDNPWPEEAVEQLQENFGGRIEILPAAGEEFQDFAQVMEEEGEKVRAIAAQLETEPVTKPETEPATEPETEPTLPPTTEPVTEPTIAPTQAPTVPTEEVPAFTGPDWQEEMEMTEPLETNDAPGGASWIGIALIVGVLTFLVIGALIVRSMSRKGGRYSE